MDRNDFIANRVNKVVIAGLASKRILAEPLENRQHENRRSLSYFMDGLLTFRKAESPAFPCAENSARPRRAPADDRACLSLCAHRRCNQARRYSKASLRALSRRSLSEYSRGLIRSASPASQRAASSPRAGSAEAGPADASTCQRQKPRLLPPTLSRSVSPSCGQACDDSLCRNEDQAMRAMRANPGA